MPAIMSTRSMLLAVVALMTAFAAPASAFQAPSCWGVSTTVRTTAVGASRPSLMPRSMAKMETPTSPPPRSVAELMAKLRKDGSSLMWSEVMQAVEEGGYVYSKVAFVNGDVKNEAGTNEGSAKLLSLGLLVGMSEEELLQCWGEHYRSVLDEPQGTDHGNIRAFLKTGWAGVSFPQGLALKPASQ